MYTDDTSLCCNSEDLSRLREPSLSLTGTRAEANLQGYEIFEDYLCGFKIVFEKFVGV